MQQDIISVGNWGHHIFNEYEGFYFKFLNVVLSHIIHSNKNSQFIYFFT